MTKKHSKEYRDPEISQRIIEKIKGISQKKVRLMEVCGTHTMAIFKSGIRSLLPPTITLLSGPGCPVCVTARNEIDAFIEISKIDDVIVATFGDLIRVPGTNSSLQKEKAEGRDIRIVYSAMDAIEIARNNPQKKVVFLGVGFETTAPTIAASILVASQTSLENYLVYSAHKLVPPALSALMENKAVNIDGFLLPGHVSVIIGSQAYKPFFNKYHLPCSIAGFEPADLLQSILMLVDQIESNKPRLDNDYSRAVTNEGNVKAKKLLEDIFKIVDTKWRGIGTIKQSGLKIRKCFEIFDAQKQLEFVLPPTQPPRGCLCGEILIGAKIPPECPLYKKVCTPQDPEGPCMVSSEGTCAAYYRFHS